MNLKGGAAMAMKRKSVIGLSIIILLLTVLVGTAWASEPVPQSFTTPTPHASGEIYYVVQEGESCVAIGLKLQMDWNEIRNLNGLDESCNLQPGQELLIGFGATQTPLPVDAPTSEVPGTTPTVEESTGEICVFLFNDINGDGVPGGNGEYPIADGAVSVTDKDNRISQTKNTVWDETSVCFEELPSGEYNISVAPPQGYNPTSNMNYPLTLAPGQSSKINFGAQESSEAPVESNVPGEEDTNTGSGNLLLGIFGILLVVAGIVLGVYFWLVRR
jgi:hypothetical protein